MRSIVTAIAVLGIAVTAVIGVAPANAGVSGTSSHSEPGDPDCVSNLRTRATFNHSSDNLIARDECSDGWGSNGEIRITETGRREFCENNGGYNTDKPCNFDFAENRLGLVLAYSDDEGAFRGAGDPVAIIT